MSESTMQQNKGNDAFLEQRLDAICDGSRKAIDREVKRRRKAGLPIYVSENGRIVDLQKCKRRN